VEKRSVVSLNIGKIMALGQAILASLVDGSCSGYDLAKQFDGTVGFFWSATHQQIYRELSKLEAQGWITSQIIPQEGRPDKKLYRITELGTQQLIEWIAQPCEPSPIKDDLLVKLFAGHIAPPKIILDQLAHHQKAHQARLSTYRDLQRQHFSQPEELSSREKFQYLTLLNGISYETHWLSWCNQAMELLRKSRKI
jgi:DNA-binding PadR family transcriptional regulator